MNLYDIIGLHHPEVRPQNSKLHLATHPGGGSNGPLEAFFGGFFEGWQSWQSKKNFERPYVVSLIKLHGERWLFAGCYRRLGRSWVEEPSPPHWSYQTEELGELAPLAGRLVVHFRRSGRASYLNAERWAERLEVGELLPKRMSVGDFPGYHHLVISKATLDVVVRQQGIQSLTILVV